MYKNLIKLLFCTVIIVMVGCRKDEYTETTVTELPPIINIVETGLAGLVSDAAGEPLPGAVVTARSQSATTDANGYFSFDNVVLDGESSLVTVTKDGHFTAYKKVFPTKQGKSFAQFAMVPRGAAKSMSASTGGSLDIQGQATVDFPANGFVKSNGDSYNGTVNIYSTYFDPTDGNTFTTMPGNLGGEDKNGQQVQLGTYGMIGVELETTSGQKLNLKSGQPATIKMQIPAEIAGEAPATIPLWHFDEAIGIWKEEGVATKDGSEYVGEVAHFSFWNCDRPWPAIKLKATLLDDTGFPVNGHSVVIFAEGVGAASGVTNALGAVCGFVPAGVELTIVVYSCGEKVVEQSLGTFDDNVDIGDFTVEFLKQTTTIQGRLLDCLGLPNDDAYGVLKYSSYYNTVVHPDADGTFSKVITSCSNVENSITFYDASDLTTTATMPIDLDEDLNALGDISVCDDLDEFIRFTINGDSDTETLAVDPVVDLADGNYLRVLSSNANFLIDGVNVGSHNPTSSDFTANASSQVFGLYGCGDDFSCDQLSFEILTIGTQVGEYITGTFSGVIKVIEGPTGSNFDEVQIEGQFKIKIDFAYQSASVSGLVWFDSDFDGVRTSADQFVQSNGSIWMRNDLSGDDSFTAIANLDDDGTYTVDRIRPGDYKMTLSGSNNFDLTGTDIGGDDTVDNDFSLDQLSKVKEVSLVEGSNLEHVDAGIRPTANLDFRLFHIGCQSETQLSVNILDGVPPYTIRVNGSAQLTTVDQQVLLDLPGGQEYEIEVVDALGIDVSKDYFLPINGVRLAVNVFEDTAPNIEGNYNAGLEDLLAGVTIEVYDDSDMLVETFLSTDETFESDVTELPAGDYYFRTSVPAGFKYTTKPTFSYGANIMNLDTGISDVFSIECNNTYYFFVGVTAE